MITEKLKNELIAIKECLNKKDRIIKELETYIKKKYKENSIKVYVNEYNVEVSSENFQKSWALYHEIEKQNTEPNRICNSNRKMPETAEEFIEMKSKMDKEKEALSKAFHEVLDIWFPEKE